VTAAVTLRGSARPLADVYDTALLDLDGVVYVGTQAVAHAPETLAAARARGMHLAFVTNNAARMPATVAAQLTRLGVPAAPADVVTAAQAAARLVAEHVPAGAAVLVVGGDGLEQALRERGLRPVRSADDGPAAVVQGYAPDVDWRQLAEASYAVARGIPWIASNLDLTIPTGRGIAPGNGALVGTVRIATGAEPLVAGKPELPLHRETILRTGARNPLVVGDRLDTDIEGAQHAGVDSLLVMTGVTTAALLVAAAPERRPTYLAADLRGLLTAHPEVSGHGDGWACGPWHAAVRDGEAVLERDAGAVGADPYEGLRALCAAAWSCPEPPQVAKALNELGV
jgi:glycerol-1-phosphatase